MGAHEPDEVLPGIGLPGGCVQPVGNGAGDGVHELEQLGRPVPGCLIQHGSEHRGVFNFFPGKVQQELHLLVEAPGVAVHLHPCIRVIGEELVVLGGDDQFPLPVGEGGVDPLPMDVHGHKFRVPVYGQDRFLLRADFAGSDQSFYLLLAQFRGGDGKQSPAVLGGDLFDQAPGNRERGYVLSKRSGVHVGSVGDVRKEQSHLYLAWHSAMHRARARQASCRAVGSFWSNACCRASHASMYAG